MAVAISGVGTVYLSGIPYQRLLVFCVLCFVDNCLSCFPLSCWPCIVCPSIYDFWFPLWYLQIFLFCASFLYCYSIFRIHFRDIIYTHQSGRVRKPLADLNRPHCYACPKRVSYKKQELLTHGEHLSSPLSALVGSMLLIFLVFCVVLLCVFTFCVSCCDVNYDFRIKTMFGLSLLSVVCSRSHVFLCMFCSCFLILMSNIWSGYL